MLLQRNRFIGGALCIDLKKGIYDKPTNQDLNTTFALATILEYDRRWVQCISCYLIYDGTTLRYCCPWCTGMITCFTRYLSR